MKSEAQEVFRELHNHRAAVKEFYQSPLGQLIVRYLNSEYEARVDGILFGAGAEKKDAELKGEAKAFYAVKNLPEYLYSVELKEEVGTEVE